jgi:hypothetical protein
VNQLLHPTNNAIKIAMHMHSTLWLAMYRFWIPLLRKLPERWKGDWLEYVFISHIDV